MPTASTKLSESEIIELVLAWFQQALREPLRGWLARLLFQPPHRPTSGYVQQFSHGDDQGHIQGSVISTWRITADTVEHMPSSFVVPSPDMASTHFESAYFSFTLPRESGYGCIGSQFGPRWGHGGQYHVSVDDGAPQIVEDGGWIS